MSGFNPKWIIGKTVSKVQMRPFPAGEQSTRLGDAFNPRITFTDGSAIEFSTQETEVGEYGTEINYRKRPAPKDPNHAD